MVVPVTAMVFVFVVVLGMLRSLRLCEFVRLDCAGGVTTGDLKEERGIGCLARL